MKALLILSLSALSAIPVAAQNTVKMQECVLENGILKNIEVDYNPGNGERSVMVNGIKKNFYDVYPKKGPGYAEGSPWFINNDPISFQKKAFKKYGLPRVLGINEIVRSGEYKAVGVYTEAGLKGPVQVIYLPVRQGCEFQPYEVDCGRVTVEKVNTTKTTMEFVASPSVSKPTYLWSSNNVRIIKGQGTPKITVDIKNKKENDTVNILLKLNEKSCPVYFTSGFVVNR